MSEQTNRRGTYIKSLLNALHVCTVVSPVIESVLLFLEVCKAPLCLRNQIQMDIQFNWVQVGISHARVDRSRLIISSDHVGSPNHHKNGFFGTVHCIDWFSFFHNNLT